MDDIYSSREITSADAGTVVIVCKKGSPTVPHAISHVTIGATSAQQLDFYRNETVDATKKIGTLKASIVENTYWFKTHCNEGLAVNVPSSYTGFATIYFR